MKLAVVLFNLGGPDRPEAVEPFLRTLFSDPAIVSLPSFLRIPLGRLIARRRAPLAQTIYARIGGRSPILQETQAQARALESALAATGIEARAFVAMRYWHPFSEETARALRDWAPERIVLLPLYPQFSTTTTQSSLDDWKRAAGKVGIAAPQSQICCYPTNDGFIETLAGAIRERLAERRPGLRYRLLLSAHGLPERVIARGDPYRWQIEQTAKILVEKLGTEISDQVVCYQSRVGPLAWIGPSTDGEIRRAGREGLGVIVAPIAFVSEHSETLVELDIEYAKLAAESGVPHYLRSATVGVRGAFIEALAGLVRRAVVSQGGTGCANSRLCPAELSRCGHGEAP